jgi:hypothetical protein
MLGVLAVTLFLVCLPVATFAQNTEPIFTLPNPTITIPGVSKFVKPPTGPCPAEVGPVGVGQDCIFFPWIGQYLNGIYTFAIYAASVLAAIVLAVAGFIWLTAAGNTTRIEQAKNYASGALLGLVLMLGSYTVLYIVNPDLVTFKSLAVISVKNVPLKQVALIKYAGLCSWQNSQSMPLISPGNACPDGSVDLNGSPETACTGGPGFFQVCCCQKPKASNNGDDINFQGTIERQMADASPALAALINCIGKQVPITINSISDSNISAGTCRPWECATKGKGSCQHECSATKMSAHYGGKNGTVQAGDQVGFSCGVDIDNTMPYSQLEEAAKTTCHAGYTLNEKNHYHVSIPGCEAN